jgi:hypothetical protein
MSHTYAFIITNREIDTSAINLPNGISIHETHPLYSKRCLVLVTSGANIDDAVSAVLTVYPDAHATQSRDEADDLLNRRHITPHKGGRTVKRSLDVTPETNDQLRTLREVYGVTLGDLVDAASAEMLKTLEK